MSSTYVRTSVYSVWNPLALVQEGYPASKRFKIHYRNGFEISQAGTLPPLYF